MKKELIIVIALMLCVAWTLPASAQTTVESIRKEYQTVQQDIALMMPNEEGETPSPPVYYDLNVSQNLPGTGPHHEHIRMYYNELEADEDEVYPPHYLRFTTAKYNFAAREFYEEYLYDAKGQVMFIYVLTPDVADDLSPCELRMWFDGKRLLRFSAKKYKGEELFNGTTIPEPYQGETDRSRQRALRFLDMFKGIDDNTYL